MISNRGLRVSKSKNRGLGVFAAKSFKEGEIIEIAPVLILNQEHMDKIYEAEIMNYTYQWGRNKSKAAIALGYASMYNHSYRPNGTYSADHKNKVLTFVAIKSIKKGEEVTINYNGTPESQKPLWFDVIED